MGYDRARKTEKGRQLRVAKAMAKAAAEGREYAPPKQAHKPRSRLERAHAKLEQDWRELHKQYLKKAAQAAAWKKLAQRFQKERAEQQQPQLNSETSAAAGTRVIEQF